jgi:aspartyl protease family protein
MNLHHAEQLGVNFRRGRKGAASTAGGMVSAYHVPLEKLTIGNITLHQVEATVVIGDFPSEILLGNSFLSRVEMSEEEGVMVLRTKY